MRNLRRYEKYPARYECPRYSLVGVGDTGDEADADRELVDAARRSRFHALEHAARQFAQSLRQLAPQLNHRVQLKGEQSPSRVCR